MNKGRIMRALQKDGIEQVRFYNTDGALGYRPMTVILPRR